MERNPLPRSAKQLCVLSLSLLMTGLLTQTALAQKKGGGKVQDTPVTATVLQETDIAGDSLQTYRNAVDRVESVIQAIGDWVVDLTASNGRTFTITFPPEAPLGPLVVTPGRIISKCSNNPANEGKTFLTLGLGESIRPSLSVRFIDPETGRDFAIRMNPSVHPDTDWMYVTCIGVDTAGACNRWTVTVDPESSSETEDFVNIGHLLEFSTQGKPVTTDHGAFPFSFEAEITRP